MKKVYIVNGDGAYKKMFLEYGFILAPVLYEADLICFTGGADVSPYLYGDIQHYLTYNNPKRDEEEKEIYQHCLREQIPMVGICRGGQFLNVMNGGRMFQHVTKHAIGGLHWVLTDKNEEIRVTSTHHQMFMPGTQAIIKATAHEHGEREWVEKGEVVKEKSDVDYEVLFYPSSKSLCFQPHPEMMIHSRMTQWFFELIEENLHV